VLPKQPPIMWVPPIRGAQGAAFHHCQEIIALTTAADIDKIAWAGQGWVCFTKTQRFQETNVTDPIPQTHCNWTRSSWAAQQALPKHGAFCMADAGGTHNPGSPKAAQIASLCYLFACSSGATAGADAGISVEALILFILQPKLGHQCCQEACFFWSDTQRIHF